MKSIEQWFWYFFLGTVAWQTRLIFWHDGLRFSEWTAMAVWLSDVFILGLVGLAVIQGWRPRVQKHDWLLMALVGIGALSLTQTVLPVIGWYQLLRLFWFILFFFYLRQWVFPRCNAVASALAFVVGALGQAALGIAQFLVQRDIGLRWIGETLLRTDMLGVAVFFDTAGEKVLRAYGTLPHPNILAAYLMVAFWILLWLWVRHGGRAYSWVAALILLTWGMLATFSRTVILVWLVSMGLFMGAMFWPRISQRWQEIHRVHSRLVAPIITTLLALVIFSTLFWSQVHARLTVHTSEEAVQLRIAFARNALETGQSWLLRVNWIGVGIGNFTPWLATHNRTLPTHLVQPAHNVYLLMYSEMGLLGVGVFLAWLATLLRRGWRRYADQPVLRMGLFLLAGSLLIIALNDHFPWTLQQGRLLFWMMLALL